MCRYAGTLCLYIQGTSGRASEVDAASVYGYDVTLISNRQETSGQARKEDATSVYEYTGTL